MWKNWLSYLASGTTLAVLLMTTSNANAGMIITPSLISQNPSFDRAIITLNLVSSSLNISKQHGQPILHNLGCTCASCQKVSTQVPL